MNQRQVADSLRNRSQAHRMRKRGTPVSYIADYMGVNEKAVQRWLQLPDPGVKPHIYDDGWRDEAICRQFDPEMFYPDHGQVHMANQAKRICNDFCPVRDECLAYALRVDEIHGVWGGMSPNERWKLSRGRKPA